MVSDPQAVATSAASRSERERIVEALRRVGGNRKEAARLLGMARSTVYRKLADYGLDERRVRSLRRIAFLSEQSYHGKTMRGITIKLPDATLKRLQQQARETGRSVAALVRERVEAGSESSERSIYALTSDLAGAIEGPRKAATNARRRFAKR